MGPPALESRLPPSPRVPSYNSQLPTFFSTLVLFIMLKSKVRQAVPKPQERTHRTTGINLPTATWELLRRVAFERSRRSGGRGSVSALLVQLVEQHKRELEKELVSASR